jgi:hypothetical protein
VPELAVPELAVPELAVPELAGSVESDASRSLAVGSEVVVSEGVPKVGGPEGTPRAIWLASREERLAGWLEPVARIGQEPAAPAGAGGRAGSGPGSDQPIETRSGPARFGQEVMRYGN